jgi:RNA-binding protein Luc7-like 2
MKVCEVCGALQSLTDTDKRLSMHLEGKLHTGYLKIRKVLTELVAKQEEYKRMRERGRRDGLIRSRSRTPSPVRSNAKVQA